MAVNVIGTYRASSSDSQFACQTGSGPCGVVLPALTTVADGYIATAWDAGVNAGSNNITLLTPDGALINGQASLAVTLSGGSVTVVKNGSAWSAAGAFKPASNTSANVIPYWAVQAVTTSAATVSVTATYLACNFAGTVAITLPAITNAGLVYGKPVFIQNQANTGNTTTNYVRIIGTNQSASINGTNADVTISTALGGKTLIPTATGWWTY